MLVQGVATASSNCLLCVLPFFIHCFRGELLFYSDLVGTTFVSCPRLLAFNYGGVAALSLECDLCRNHFLRHWPFLVVCRGLTNVFLVDAAMDGTQCANVQSYKDRFFVAVQEIEQFGDGALTSLLLCVQGGRSLCDVNNRSVRKSV